MLPSSNFKKINKNQYSYISVKVNKTCTVAMLMETEIKNILFIELYV